MKKITPTILLAIFISQFSFGQDSSEIKNPVYELTIRTMNNNKMTGLLVNITDSTLAIYPGTKSQLKKGMNFQRASFTYENIKEIKAKKKGAGLRGAAIGAGVGMVPVVHGMFNPPGKGNMAVLGVLTVPGGALAGALIGTVSSSKNARIDGDREKFKQFLTRID